MRYTLSQYQKMKQKMALTPQMRQSMQILSMPAQELSEYINSAVDQNPLLKKEDRIGKDSYPTTHVPVSGDYTQAMTTRDENPRLSLISHLRTINLDDKTMEIAEYLIYEMDPNGYIQLDTEEVAKNFFVTPEEVEKVLLIIQGMDPPGIGARDIRECLQLQLKRMNKQDSLEYAIVTDYINELATEDIKKISHTLKADRAAVVNAIKNIKKLNPRPGSTVLSEAAKPVVPDLIAHIKNDKIRLEFNREYLPRLRLYNPYQDKFDIIKDPEVKEFLKKNINTAKNLIDGLRRREETMCRVADYILNVQKDYIAKDISRINSLTIQDIAQVLKMHPSTISRTVSDKYIQINDKVMSLKGLLSRGIKKENGQLASKTSIKSIIKKLIDSEDKARPLSDNTIKKELEKEGIAIKRRTVAKYREAQRILPTHLRRKRSS